MGKKYCYIIALLLMLLLAACKPAQSGQAGPSQLIVSDKLSHATPQPTPTAPMVVIPSHKASATSTPTPATRRGSNPNTNTTTPSVKGSAPYGPPPAMTAEESQLAQQLFGVINHDRAVRGLYAFSWNSTLAGGARLHSWNMVHCGFSHTCPDGRTSCQRLAAEGLHFPPFDCGENIAYAGPYPSAWQGVYNIQEGMVNEPPNGWHRLHLLSTSYHLVGVGVYVDSHGYIWFTEDFVG